MTDSSRLRAATLVLALAGLAVASYLTYVHYADVKPICSSISDCERVQTSDYAMFLGVPVALLGVIGYVSILGSLALPDHSGVLAGAFLGIVAAGFSAYLTYVELVEIDAICQWCVGSAIIAGGLAVLGVARLLR